MRDFLEEQGASEAALEAMMYYYMPAYGDSLDEINLLQVVRETVSFTKATGAFTVAGGNDRICGELARLLGDRVHYQSPVRAVRQDEAGISLTLETGSGTESVTADIAILTPPPPVLRTIDFGSLLPEATNSALRAAIPVPATQSGGSLATPMQPLNPARKLLRRLWLPPLDRPFAAHQIVVSLPTTLSDALLTELSKR